MENPLLELKTCRNCKQEKPAYLMSHRPVYMCKECVSAKVKGYREKREGPVMHKRWNGLPIKKVC